MSYTTPPTHIYMLPPPDVPDIFVEGWCVCVWVVEASTSIKAEVEVKVVPDYTKLFTTRQYQWWMVKYDNDQNLKKWHFIPTPPTPPKYVNLHVKYRLSLTLPSGR